MAKPVVSFELDKELLKMVEQRVIQQGVTRSEYIREAIILELLFSGDLEATKFIAKRVGNRIKLSIRDKLAGVDISEQLEGLKA